MKLLLLGMLCALAVGCNETNRPGTSSISDPPKAVTVQRPVIADGPEAAPNAMGRTNTGVNVRDQVDTAKTPLDQNENTSDIDITADIRKQVVDTKMSVNAQNVKVITQDGHVTLRGPVESEEEKQRIEEIANAVAGANNVDSQLEVNGK